MATTEGSPLTANTRYLHSANPAVGTACRDCGVGVIHDTKAHDEWHAQDDEAKADADDEMGFFD